MWSAWLARYYEQGNIADALWILPEGSHLDDGDLGQPGSNGDWASPYPGFANARIDAGKNDMTNWGVGGASGPATERCVAACETVVSILRCPSSALPEHVYGPSYEDWIVQKRVPINYAVSAGSNAMNSPMPTDGTTDASTTTIGPITRLYVNTDIKQCDGPSSTSVRVAAPIKGSASGSRSRRSPMAPRTRSSWARSTISPRPRTT